MYGKLLLFCLIFLLFCSAPVLAGVPNSTGTIEYIAYNGTDGSTIFTSEMEHTITKLGSPYISRTQPKFGSGSLKMPTSADYVRSNIGVDGNTTARGYTIEAQVNLTSTSDYYTIASASGVYYWRIGAADNQIMVYPHRGDGAYDLRWTWVASLGWHHHELNYNGTHFSLYIDGVRLTPESGNPAVSKLAMCQSASWYFGSDGASGLRGTLDEVLFSNYAKHGLTNFVPPTEEAMPSPASDTTPPASIQGLSNTTISCNSTTWNWTNPLDADYFQLVTYSNNALHENLSNSTVSVIWAGLNEGSWYNISTHTKDLTGNVNGTWVNASAYTQTCGAAPTPTPTPTVSTTPTVPNLPAGYGKWWLQDAVEKNVWWLVLLILTIIIFRWKNV